MKSCPTTWRLQRCIIDADDIYTRPLAIRMRYMCIYACAVLLIGGRAGPIYRFTDSWSLTSLLRVGHRVATLLDSTRESILALRYNFCRLQGTQSCRGKPVLICILALSLVFTPYLSNTVASAKSPHNFSCPCSTEAVGIAHKPPRSL